MYLHWEQTVTEEYCGIKYSLYVADVSNEKLYRTTLNFTAVAPPRFEAGPQGSMLRRDDI